MGKPPNKFEPILSANSTIPTHNGQLRWENVNTKLRFLTIPRSKSGKLHPDEQGSHRCAGEVARSRGDKRARLPARPRASTAPGGRLCCRKARCGTSTG